MPSPLPALQRERLRLFLRIMAISAAVGALFGALLTPNHSTPVFSMLVGIANGIVVAGFVAGCEIFLLREGPAVNRLAGLPFIALVLLKTVVYGSLVTVVVAGAPYAAAFLLHATRPKPLDLHTTIGHIGVSLAITAIFVIVLQAAGLVGRRTFRNLVLGRYRQPRAERRFFLFVDVVGSTGIAERLGPLQAHRFLAAVFSATAEPIAACRGEIYQYVGDEIVVTWTEEEGKPDARPLRCFFLMEEALAAVKDSFRGQFAAEPGLRAALHLGEVIAGEVGEQRRAIVYHGDVMNTAARLEQATRDTGCRFIASAAALESLEPQAGLDCRDLGALALRGRSEPVRAFAVSAVPGPAAV